MQPWRDSLNLLRLQLENFEREQERDVKFRLFLHDLDKRISDARGDLAAVVPFVIERLPEFVPCDLCEVLVADGPDLVIKFSSQAVHVGARIPIDKSITGKAFLTRTPVIINSLQDETPHKDLYYQLLPAMQSEIAFPIIDGNAPLAVINLESRVRYAFEPEIIETLKLLGGQITIAVRDAIAADFQKGAQVLTTRIMSGDLALAGAFEQILNDALSQIGNRPGVVGQLLLVQDETLLLAHSTNQAGEVVIDPNSSVSGRALKDRKTIHIEDLASAAPELRSLYRAVASGMRSELAVPLMTDTGAVGVLNLESPYPSAFTPRDVQIIEMYAGQAAAAVGWAGRRKEYDAILRRDQSRAMMSMFGMMSAKVVHRLGNDAGLIKLKVPGLRAAVPKEAVDSLDSLRVIEERAVSIVNFVQQLAEKPGAAHERVSMILHNALQSAIDRAALPADISATIGSIEPTALSVSPLLGEVFDNLISNAERAIGRKRDTGGFKSTAAKIQIESRIVTGKYSGLQEAIEIRISDNGIGIPAERSKAIYQLAEKTLGAAQGFGFGLWLVKAILELHGGTISHESTEGLGASFVIRLPYDLTEGA